MGNFTGPDEPPPKRSIFVWDLPAGFPEPRVPADNPQTGEKVQLGRYLFYDRRLSGNGTASCATCHQPERGFADGRAQAVGSTGELHPRSTMSLTNVAYNVSLTWADQDLELLEDQIRIPLLSTDPVELGVTGHELAILDRLRAEPRYRVLFAEAFQEQTAPLTLENIIRALAAFVRILISGNSPYDRWVFWAERDAMSASARRGMRLFFSERLGCSECHADLNFSGPVNFRGGRTSKPAFHNTGLYNVDGKGAYPESNTGLFEHTRKKKDIGRFRAPTLRNNAVTAPYMHDGSMATLEQVVDHYAAGGRNVEDGPFVGDGRANPFKSSRVNGFEITPEEKEDLVSFLESLTDEAFLSDPRFADPWY